RDPNIDPTAWYNIAAIHEIDESNEAAKITKIPTNIRALWHQCHNDPVLFFAWHRAYVWSVEKLMQDAVHDPNFRLPYWNWYVHPSLPVIFRSPTRSATDLRP